MKKIALLLLLLTALIVVTGCENQTHFNVGEHVEFLPESGASQYVMMKSLSQAVAEIDFKKYEKKQIYLEWVGGTSYTQGTLINLVEDKLRKAGAVILSRLSDEEKEKGKQEEPGDFELQFTILASGVHSYDGLIWKNIDGIAMIGLSEKSVADGKHFSFSGKMHRYSYEHWVFSPFFIGAVLALFVLGLLGFIMQRLMKK